MTLGVLLAFLLTIVADCPGGWKVYSQDDPFNRRSEFGLVTPTGTVGPALVRMQMSAREDTSDSIVTDVTVRGTHMGLEDFLASYPSPCALAPGVHSDH